MSQQVYISPYQKYLPSVGYNVFVNTVTQTVATGTTASATFPSTLTLSDTTDFSFNGTTISILQDGIYCLSSSLILEDAVSTTSNDLDFGTFFYGFGLTGMVPPELYLSQSNIRIPARGADPGSDQFSYPISTTFYMRQGLQLQLRVSNFASTTLNILPSSGISIQRIA